MSGMMVAERTIPGPDLQATGADRRTTEAIDHNDFAAYRLGIVHDWLKTVTALAFVLVPLFFVLDIFIAPRDLLLRFGLYRAVSALVVILQHLYLRNSKPTGYSYLHGYFVSLQVGGFIALMTVHLGGVESGYYVGLILVIIGVNLLMPWEAIHTAINCLIIVVMYVGFNLAASNQISPVAVANNLFFLLSVALVSVAINHVRHGLLKTEFSLLVQLKKARDSLWSEMELAKKIQVALLPKQLEITGYDIAVSYLPAKEVGGDYYDLIETEDGSRYIAIGDVAGHGLDSGLIMMMAQTSVMAVVKGREGCTPAEVLESTNTVLRENVGRLESNHYMSMTVVKLEDEHLTAAGHHQDILIYRRAAAQVEVVSVAGTWLGIANRLDGFLHSVTIPIDAEDYVLFFSDGVTEATSPDGRLYGQDRLAGALARWAHLDIAGVVEHIVNEITEFQGEQLDDMTLILAKRSG